MFSYSIRYYLRRQLQLCYFYIFEKYIDNLNSYTRNECYLQNDLRIFHTYYTRVIPFINFCLLYLQIFN